MVRIIPNVFEVFISVEWLFEFFIKNLFQFFKKKLIKELSVSIIS
jgi:hypothetical protein